MKKNPTKIEIVQGVEGQCLVVNDYRVAGPKPWGGGTVIKTWVREKKDFKEALKKAFADNGEIK